MPYDDHKGLLKVGEATLKSNKQPNDILPNSRDLNQAAHARIKQEVGTASVRYTLLHTELAVRTVGNYLAAFSDKDVQKVLMNSGIHKVQPNGKTGAEWFATNIETAKAAIKALKEGKSSLSSADIAKNTPHETIEFREEQIDAVNKTLRTFKKDDEMLWYAKMRFGKTLTALEVIRRSQYRRVIIVTHRPVVDDGWSDDFKKVFFPGNSEHDYFYERKTKDSAYIFDEKTDYENDLKIRNHDKNRDYFIYFASMQDLRGSKIVGGKFNKNNAVFDLDWDLIIIDEAHEGTQTELGDNVVKALKKEHTKVLALSGTPFNLLDKFGEDNVYTWDYVMEQKKKSEWDLVHYGDHNPYADLPQMHIYTYDLGEKLKKYISDDYGTKAFNFREFFRVWYKGPNGNRELPKNAVEGKFVHENDVNAFLDLMVTEDANSGYPYSTQEYRDMFRHTLWMVPGVKEAKALSELLRSHHVFKNFGIANVAGEGDKYEEEHSNDALELVRKTIEENDYSITLSCGKLTTGVTVKEWTAVLMLSGSYSTAAAQYMQTIFRVQSAGAIDGKQKTDCYVFDFAPDRTLKVLTETVHLSRKPGKSQQKRREAMTEFLNYCPVIAIAGSKTKTYSVESMMEQIKQIYAERAVNSGFEDESLYNDELLKLNEIDASKFNELKDIIGASKASKKKKDVVVNGQGLTDEQIEHLDDPEPATPPTPSTPEEQEERKKKKQAKEASIEEATRCNSFYVTERWLGGTLTNFKTIRDRVKRLIEIEKMEESGKFELLPKKEVAKIQKEYDKLNKLLSGVRDMDKLPKAIIVVDPRVEINAIREARKLHIPVFGIVDTNCDPDDVDFPIPANDDAVRSVKVVLGVLANAVCEANGLELIDFVSENEVSSKPVIVIGTITPLISFFSPVLSFDIFGVILLKLNLLLSVVTLPSLTSLEFRTPILLYSERINLIPSAYIPY